MWLNGPVEVELGFDAEFCPDPVPAGYPWCMVYAGGSSAAHPWSDAELGRVAGLRRLPVWVPTPGTDEPDAEAGNFIAWLALHRVPVGAHVMWDMETGRRQGDDPGWLDKAADVLAKADYLNLVYGNVSTLFGALLMPPRSGYVVADPTGQEHLFDRPGVRGTQWAFDVRVPGGTVDLDVLDASVAARLWLPS